MQTHDIERTRFVASGTGAYGRYFEAAETQDGRFIVWSRRGLGSVSVTGLYGTEAEALATLAAHTTAITEQREIDAM